MKLQFSRRLALALLAGFAVTSLIAGYLLRRRRRRYRAVPTSSSARAGGQSLHRSFTFQAESRERGITRVGEKTTQLLVLQEVPNTFETILGSESGDEEDFVEAEDRSWPLKKTVPKCSSPASDSSSDSFHSTLDDLSPPRPLSSPHQLYSIGLHLATQGQVTARTIRTKELYCSGDLDFLAKLYCVRLAFDELTREAANRHSFQQMGRDIMSSFLSAAGNDPALFCERFDDLLSVLAEEEGRRQAELELRERNVVAMNVYDVALDFVLLDAFSDLEAPPSTVVAVLQNSWITDGMKKSALSAAVWSLLKAKRSMLSNKDGFMGRFYLLSEVITPVMAWGFLGTDLALQQHCVQLKTTITGFLQDIFSLSEVRYSSVECLAEDILTLAQQTGQDLFTVL